VPNIENNAELLEMGSIWPFASAHPRGAKLPAKTHMPPSMGESPLQACALLLMSIPENSEAAIVMDKAVRRIGNSMLTPFGFVYKINFEYVFSQC
jgi:hypothetical protein